MTSGRTMVIGAHPDDMEISCGALVSYLVAHNIPVKSIVIASERQGQTFADGQRAVIVRQAEAVEASKVLGIESPVFLDCLIGQIDYTTLRIQLESIICNYAPDQVLTHYPVDTHFDHAIIGTILNDIFQHSEKVRFHLYFFRSPGSYSFVETDIFEGNVDKKLEALRAHKSQGFADHIKECVASTEYFIKVVRRE